MPSTIPFSRANRRQVYTADLISALLSNLHPSVLEEAGPIKSLNSNIVDIYRQLSPDFPKFPFEAKNLKRFKRINSELFVFIKGSFKEGMTLDMLNASLVLAEKAHGDSLRATNTNLHRAWSVIIEGLFEFYEQIDPDFKEKQWMKLGVAMSEKIESILQL